MRERQIGDLRLARALELTQPFPGLEFFPETTYAASIERPRSVLGAVVGDWPAHHAQVLDYARRLVRVSHDPGAQRLLAALEQASR